MIEDVGTWHRAKQTIDRHAAQTEVEAAMAAHVRTETADLAGVMP